PHSSRDASTLSGIERIKELGLDSMEMEFVRGVHMKEELAAEVKGKAAELDVRLSAHGPYFINLNAQEKAKVKASIERILATARIGHLAGCATVTFHPAYYMKQEPGRVYDTVKERLAGVLKTLRDEGNPVEVRPETTGRLAAFGSLDEVIELSRDIDGVLPCIDFSHLHAREGKVNTYEEFAQVLGMLEEGLGRQILSNMHCHIQGIEYTSKGEKTHLDLGDSDFNYLELLEAFKEYNVKGLIVCESPNLEEDALLLKKTYQGL
ncbi:MAG: TIM barrel protein, partial [Candidatus Altiarchaeota archaeon]